MSKSVVYIYNNVVLNAASTKVVFCPVEVDGRIIEAQSLPSSSDALPPPSAGDRISCAHRQHG